MEHVLRALVGLWEHVLVMAAAPMTMCLLAIGSERNGFVYWTLMAKAAKLAMSPMIVNACFVPHCSCSVVLLQSMLPTISPTRMPKIPKPISNVAMCTFSLEKAMRVVVFQVIRLGCAAAAMPRMIATPSRMLYQYIQSFICVDRAQQDDKPRASQAAWAAVNEEKTRKRENGFYHILNYL